MTDGPVEVLRVAMLSAGMDQKRLARQSGVSEATISRILSGARPGPRATTLRKIADALGKQCRLDDGDDTAETVRAKFAGVRHAMRMARWQ